MAKPRLPIEIGKEYGWLTVLGTAPKDRTGHLQFKVRCRCGFEYTAQPAFLKKAEPKCRFCRPKACGIRRRLAHPGDEINGWKVLEEAGRNEQGAVLYRCRCMKCGELSLKTQGSMRAVKGNGCIHCKPNYHFQIQDGVGRGILSDGTAFMIDADLIPAFEQYYWRVDCKGYIRRSNKNMPKLLLHWMVMGYDHACENPIDHINRDKTDCRRCNLRFVTDQQNSMNRSMQSNNRSGYIGVSYSKKDGTYGAKIGLNNKNIYLGYTKDIIAAAQMRNYAAQLLFREYCGALNPVPEAPAHIKAKVERKLMPYMEQALIATQPCEGG